MILKKLTLEGFKCFSNKEYFYFGNNKGLYSLTGINNVDKRLGSNGAGKSTIWDGMSWVLYGKTVRGLKAGDLNTWFNKNKTFNGKIEWENNDKEYVLYRQWSPNKLILTIDGKSENVEQYKIDEVFGIPYKPFLFSVIMGQSRPMFFDLKESNKSILFSEVFQLDKWIVLSEKALNDFKKLESLCIDIDTSISINNSRKDVFWEQIFKNKILGRKWDKMILLKEKRILYKIEMVKNHLKESEKQLNDVNKEKKVLIKDIKNLSEEIRMLGKSLLVTEDRVSENVDLIAKYKSHVEVKKEDEFYFRNYIKGGNYPCTLCKQAIHPKYAATQIRGIKSKILSLGKKYSHTITEKRRWKDKLIKSKKNLLFLEKKGSKLSYNLGAINSDIEYFNKEIKSNKEQITWFFEDILKIKEESNPFNKLIKGNNYDLFKIDQQLRKLKRILKGVLEKKEQTHFWIKGFKDIRLFMISEFLIQLEIEVNNALSKLGLPDWKISFGIERETKSKTIRKGFNVLINSPLNKNLVPWESWSGGESQRLRIAGNMGLSNLILSQYGVNPNIEIWDEPSSHLGKEGLEDLLDTLHNRSQTLNKCLWVVEHNSLEFGDFVEKITVIKNENGSFIKKEDSI